MRKKVMLSVDEEFLKEIDKRCKDERMTRSAYFVFCVNREMKRHKRTTMLNDIHNALYTLEEYSSDMDEDAKKEVYDMLHDVSGSFR